MDYLLSGTGDNNLSLQDMIECDMKTEFSDNDPLIQNDLHSPLGLTNDTLSTSDLLNHNLVNFGGLPDSVGVSIAPMTNDSKPDPSWLQTVSLSTDVLQNDSVSEVYQMVNPQTGLPVQLQTVSQVQNNVVSAGSESRTPSTVQYVTATLPHGTTIQQALQGLQQQQQHINITSATQLQSVHNSQLISQALSNGTAVTLSSVSYPQLLQQQQHSPTTTSLVTQQLLNSNNNHLKKINKMDCSNGKVYPKPVYSYSCLIAMALKNCETGALPVSEIYSFMTENFPYFKTAPDGWKNSVRHNLSLNKCFEKIENPKATGNTRKGCLWGLNPAKIEKMDEEIAKWRKKDLEAIQRSMAKPEVLEILEKGNINIAKLSKRSSQHSLVINSQHEAMVQSPSPADHNSVSVSVVAAIPPAKPIVGDIQLSMIEIKPAENGIGHTPVKIKVEPIFTIKPEVLDVSGAVGGSLSSEDLNLLDTSLSMDPSLCDLAMQNSFWEELGAEGISLDDIPLMSFGPTSSSPLTVQTNKTGSSNAGAKSPLLSLLSNHTANGASGSLTTTSNPGGYTVYAQT